MGGEAREPRGFDAIMVGGIDGVGREIGLVYAKATGRYAVYGTPERVQILYADDPGVQRAQRRRLATLACLRSEIDGALGPWRRAGPQWRLGAAALNYDGRIAAGLVEALEGNVDSARRILLMIRAEVSCERTSRAQLYYLVSTIGVALAVLVPCLVALHGPAAVFVEAPPTRMVWCAVAAGVVGTVYSVALSLRNRDVSNDRRWLDHLTDAGVRICIGGIAGFVVAELLLTQALQLTLGEVRLAENGGVIRPTTANISFVLLAGFLAGFAERFVPDLLNSYAQDASPHAAPPPPPPAGSSAAPTAAPATPTATMPDGTQSAPFLVGKTGDGGTTLPQTGGDDIGPAPGDTERRDGG